MEHGRRMLKEMKIRERKKAKKKRAICRIKRRSKGQAARAG